MNGNVNDYFSGKRLYGDDFTPDEIMDWFKDEEEGYADLGAKDKQSYQYGYHALNTYHGFRFLQDRKFDRALGFGSAYGDELMPIISRINKVTILDPSEAFANINQIMDTPCSYIKPNPLGDMPFENNSFNLITCFGVMHHVPNVSYVFKECFRCLDNNGIMLFREPIVTMGDWRKPRRGLTKRERGIPEGVLSNIIQDTGFVVKHKAYCTFPLIPKLAKKLGVAAYNSQLMTAADALLSWMLKSNARYHREKPLDKLAPASIFYVLEKSSEH